MSTTRVRLPEHPCRNCKRKTTRADLCRRCASPVVLDDDVALVGGRWVPSGGVMRWESDEPREPEKAWRQLCACGEVATGQIHCDACAVESRRRSKREHMRRARAEKRAA